MSQPEYRVLARKYRPTRFADLVGQDVLVRTLTNAIESGRLAHAWLLTGIRGVGKTTTARIIAKALNCIGPDGNGNPTIDPCGICPNCTMITEDRHVDIMEMDAASRTGVGDIREIIETVHYAPANARFKVYIIDEVHMLSTSAFNALLKTLEEPPPHVKFIFATTELRKIPITILSRCQRFDLARVKHDVLAAHLGAIAAKENVTVDPEALALISTASEGSVRDGLSILDQAIAHAASGTVSAALVRGMLGLTDRTQGFTLLESTLSGDVPAALAQLHELYEAGSDPLVLLQDMLALVHLITRIKLVPSAANDLTLSETERTRGSALAEKLSTPVLTRAWQMLLKGMQETRQAPNALSAVEMALIRLMHASTLPTPAEIIRTQGNTTIASATTQSTAPIMHGNAAVQMHPVSAPVLAPIAAAPARPALSLVQPEPQTDPMPENFEALVQLFAQKREMVLFSHLKQDARVVSYAPGRLELHPTPNLPQDFTTRLSRALSDWTGQRWAITYSQMAAAPTIHEKEQQHKADVMNNAAHHPLVQAVVQEFPGARLTDIQWTE